MRYTFVGNESHRSRSNREYYNVVRKVQVDSTSPFITPYIYSLTDSSQALVHSKSLQQFHAPTIRDVHLGPFCRVEITFDEHTFGAVASELERRNESSRSSSNDQHWSFVFDDLCSTLD